ncbi:hypothetical protein M0R45_000156 [Rubus argutus]|uniref:BHLH domain-containing protein n=1 Tax=Rubus argutus TaxID=59490 RepID=A0AAW1VLE5_RUBAR
MDGMEGMEDFLAYNSLMTKPNSPISCGPIPPLHLLKSNSLLIVALPACLADAGKRVPRNRVCSYINCCFLMNRGRNESWCGSGAKACREKLRRERFVDLSAVLEPGRPAKTDKPAILDDAIRVLTQLRAETQELTQTNEKLLEEIKSLKAEKNELREEKSCTESGQRKTGAAVESYHHSTFWVYASPPSSPCRISPWGKQDGSLS